MNIQEVKYTFIDNLTTRNSTKYIVVHHTATTSELTPQDIHRIHLNEKFIGIGYHFYINKNGITFTGRPLNAVGSHAYPINSNSVGVCISGNFEIEKPNQKQITALTNLIKTLKSKYPNSIIISHSQVKDTQECKDHAKRSGNDLSYYATACCGKNLISLLPAIIKSEKDKIKLWIQNGKARAVINGKWFSCPLNKDINLGELHLMEE